MPAQEYRKESRQRVSFMGYNKKFPLPRPNEIKFTYCKIPIPGAPKTGMLQRRFYDCGYCAGCGQRQMYRETASVAGFPFLCEDCYRMVYRYSLNTSDPYRIKALREDDEVDEEMTCKVIDCGRRMTIDDNLPLQTMLYYDSMDPNEE